jgi:hypothetical protein
MSEGAVKGAPVQLPFCGPHLALVIAVCQVVWQHHAPLTGSEVMYEIFSVANYCRQCCWL